MGFNKSKINFKWEQVVSGIYLVTARKLYSRGKGHYFERTIARSTQPVGMQQLLTANSLLTPFKLFVSDVFVDELCRCELYQGLSALRWMLSSFLLAVRAVSGHTRETDDSSVVDSEFNSCDDVDVT